MKIVTYKSLEESYGTPFTHIKDGHLEPYGFVCVGEIKKEAGDLDTVRERLLRK